jgi:hypothetical protein
MSERQRMPVTNRSPQSKLTEEAPGQADAALAPRPPGSDGTHAPPPRECHAPAHAR